MADNERSELVMIVTTAIGGNRTARSRRFVKWLLRADLEAPASRRLFFIPARCLLTAPPLDWAQGRLARDWRQTVAHRKRLSQIPSSQTATMVPSVARPLMVHPVA
jgi:hypothetical protein